MKAALHTRYGPPDLLQLADVQTPTPKANEILVAVRASTVSTGDCNMRNFTFVSRSLLPLARVMFGIRKPWTPRVLGTELAGEVVRVGRDVTRFKAGDRVVASTGAAGGGHAQYACLSDTGAVAIKPDSLSWQQAVAIPFGANTALYFLRDRGKIRAGQEILIIGASGAIGSAAVQFAEHLGARVTGVCSGANAELVKTLGADRVIDYTQEDFTKSDHTYDLIFDVVGATTFDRARRSLKSGGVFLQNIMGLSDIVRALWTSVAGGKKVKGGVAMANMANMDLIAALAESGRLRPVIDRTYPLERIAEAFQYVEQGHKRGNVVITVTPAQSEARSA